MGLFNKDILNIVNQLVYKHHIKIINRYYSDIVVSYSNDSIALHIHSRIITLNWRSLKGHRYVYNFNYTQVCKLPTLH